MAGNPTLEVRVELYVDGGLPVGLPARISTVLSQRWPVAWDVVVPPRPSREHPAEWRGVVPLPDGMTAETLHRQVASDLRALDPAPSLHFRTRWSFLETPDHQEVFEERWTSEST